MTTPVRLHVNVDHVGTIRQARGTSYPSPVEAGLVAERSGADGITVHLREDRRHVQDEDVRALRARLKIPLNLEMACTDEMIDIARGVLPDIVTLVPERREERTTEGGLDVLGARDAVSRVVATMRPKVDVSLFIAPTLSQVDAAAALGANVVEFHTGDYAHAIEDPARLAHELDRIRAASLAAKTRGMRVAAGHGLTRANVNALLRACPDIEELNIGHSIIADSIFVGLADAIRGMREAMIAPLDGAVVPKK